MLAIWLCPENLYKILLHKYPLRSYTFQCVPARSVICFSRSDSCGLRSYAFRATLPLICDATMRSDTFQLRSVYVPPSFLMILLKCYTFPCVPCEPPAKCESTYTFLYVPDTFLLRSCGLFAKMRVPIMRSYTFLAAVFYKVGSTTFQGAATQELPEGWAHCCGRPHTFRTRSAYVP